MMLVSLISPVEEKWGGLTRTKPAVEREFVSHHKCGKALLLRSQPTCYGDLCCDSRENRCHRPFHEDHQRNKTESYECCK